jgi:hypothetical protein
MPRFAQLAVDRHRALWQVPSHRLSSVLNQLLLCKVQLNIYKWNTNFGTSYKPQENGPGCRWCHISSVTSTSLKTADRRHNKCNMDTINTF